MKQVIKSLYRLLDWDWPWVYVKVASSEERPFCSQSLHDKKQTKLMQTKNDYREDDD